MNILYTAITSGRDNLILDQNFEGVTPVAFLDETTNPDRKSKIGDWFVKPVRVEKRRMVESIDPVRAAKYYKVMAHNSFPFAGADTVKYSLWIDGDVRLKRPMQEMIDLYLKDTDIAFFAHPLRDCIYQEQSVCQALALDNPFIMIAQINKYKGLGYPEHNGLIDGSVILRRHTPEIAKLNEAWWAEIKRYSRRDQISFNYVAWKLGIKYTVMDGFNHVGSNNFTELLGHAKE